MLVNEDEQGEMPQSSDKSFLVSTGFFAKRYECGHRGSRKYTIFLFGENLTFSKAKRCSDCMLEFLKKNVIRCAICGFGILPGDGVALYELPEGFNPEVTATRVASGSSIGCMRMDCCPTGGLFSGNWTEEGFKKYEFR